MKHRSHTFAKRLGTMITAFVFVLAGITVFGGSTDASAASGGFKVYNNCGSQKTFGYNRYNTPPGTGAYYKVGAGKTYTVSSGTGIFRVELPKGVFNIFVYNGNWNTVRMC
jgi:hypothetical protein